MDGYARAVMSASVSHQSPSKGGALAGYETVLRVKEGFPLRQEYLGETCSRLGNCCGWHARQYKYLRNLAAKSMQSCFGSE